MSFFGCYWNDNLSLLPRDEGKIKTFESCFDLRAWSHDNRKKDQYLRECIKYDVPVSVIPIRTLICILRSMTIATEGKIAPRCHPRCKSKVVLDSICNSCNAMKECLRNEQKFVKYFDDLFHERFFLMEILKTSNCIANYTIRCIEEEELETSDWPCEKCLEALKSIKMFWKIIVDKIFPVNIPKSKTYFHTSTECEGSVLSVAKVWHRDMMNQVSLVKSVIPVLKTNHSSSKTMNPVKRQSSPCNIHSDKLYESDAMPVKETNLNTIIYEDLLSKTVNTNNENDSPEEKKTLSLCTQISAKVLNVDTACDCISSNQIVASVNSLDKLEEKFKSQEILIDKLKIENVSLRSELDSLYKKFGWKTSVYDPSLNNSNSSECFPEPYKCYIYEENTDGSIDRLNSEMIITLKNCNDETFKHISLLQVLHKTNSPISNDGSSNGKLADPIEILTKVQNKFSAIVDREKNIAQDSKDNLATPNANTYHKINSSLSEPSCSKTSFPNVNTQFIHQAKLASSD